MTHTSERHLYAISSEMRFERSQIHAITVWFLVYLCKVKDNKENVASMYYYYYYYIPFPP